MPIQAGGKLTGRTGGTSFGALTVRTGEVEGLAPGATMGALRLRQNLLGESTAGVLATFGDPSGRAGNYLVGTDFTYQTSGFRGSKNFLVGAWGVAAGAEDAGGDRTAFGAKVDYPNDDWDIAATYKRLGKDFEPALGFVPRGGCRCSTSA